MDIPDIERVVQFMLPSSLSILIQRFGRAGRSGQSALAILLAEATAFHRKKKTRRNEQLAIKAEIDENSVPIPEGEEGEDTLGYRKKVEEGIRNWIDVLLCRWAVVNEHFTNPPSLADSGMFMSLFSSLLTTKSLGSAQTFPCCDNCIRRKKDSDSRNQGTLLTQEELDMLSIIDRLDSHTKPCREIIDVDMEPTNQAPTKTGKRRGDKLMHCRAAIVHWRTSCWSKNYAGGGWGVAALLPDNIITKLATRTHITTIESLKLEIPEWDFTERHGAEVLAVIAVADREWEERTRKETPPGPQAIRKSEQLANTPGNPANSRATLQPIPIPQPSSTPIFATPPQPPQPFPYPGYYPIPAPIGTQALPYPIPVPSYPIPAPTGTQPLPYPMPVPSYSFPVPVPVGTLAYPPPYIFYPPVGPYFHAYPPRQ
jgi:hypothetical protein